MFDFDFYTCTRAYRHTQLIALRRPWKGFGDIRILDSDMEYLDQF